MPVKQAKGVPCPDPFVLDELTLAWLEKRYPQVDAEISAERYSAWATAGGYLYINHMKAYQVFINRESDRNALGPMLKRKTVQTDTFTALEQEALRAGFRKRIGTETEAQFTAAFEAHKRANLSKLRGML